jgi:hypothetical protein
MFLHRGSTVVGGPSPKNSLAAVDVPVALKRSPACEGFDSVSYFQRFDIPAGLPKPLGDNHAKCCKDQLLGEPDTTQTGYGQLIEFSHGSAKSKRARSPRPG